uniref:Similarity n=1 Tax=Microcystis aeruginosa (strain PCC 7806) TaxID=267872 RepID=A8YD51_MICA7|nr:unnamed protein product [Microcystis aeruginosa PCC 7806]
MSQADFPVVSKMKLAPIVQSDYEREAIVETAAFTSI